MFMFLDGRCARNGGRSEALAVRVPASSARIVTILHRRRCEKNSCGWLTQQAGQERLQFGSVARERRTLTGDDGFQIGGGAREVVVYDHVVELVPMRHVDDRIAQAACDDVITVGVAASQAQLQSFAR